MIFCRRRLNLTQRCFKDLKAALTDTLRHSAPGSTNWGGGPRSAWSPCRKRNSSGESCACTPHRRGAVPEMCPRVRATASTAAQGVPNAPGTHGDPTGPLPDPLCCRSSAHLSLLPAGSLGPSPSTPRPLSNPPKPLSPASITALASAPALATRGALPAAVAPEGSVPSPRAGPKGVE